MVYLLTFILLVLSYLLGAIPFGYLLVKVFTGQDVRQVASGRTGGTNAMRAAGFPIGLATSLLDILKSAGAVWISRAVFPDMFWLHVLAGVISVVGHNYSPYLIQRDSSGRIILSGGAGGTPAVGAIVGLWWPSILILVPVGYLMVMGIGYASLATMTLPLIGSLIMLVRYLLGHAPPLYILSGFLSEVLIVWALRPNIKRLLNGTERLVGFRARKKPPSPE